MAFSGEIDYQEVYMHKPKQVLEEGIPAESLVLAAQGVLKGDRGYSFHMMDGTRMFVPTPSDAEVEVMWKNITAAVWGNMDFFLYYRSVVNVTQLLQVCTKTEDVEQPTLILRFQSGFELPSPYESLARLESDHKEILAVMCKLNGLKVATLPPSQLH